MEPELVLSEITGPPKDDIEKHFIEDVLTIVLNRDTQTLINYWGETKFNKNKIGENYLMTIIDVVRSLIKANHHRREYLDHERVIEKEILEINKNTDSGIPIVYERPDLISEVDAFLAQLKSALDSLAKSLNPIFNLKINGWHKGKTNDDKIEKSGIKIINTLNYLEPELRNKVDDLINFIEDNIDYISAIVFLRDSPIHHGKIKNIQGFVYYIKDKKLMKPILVLKDKNVNLSEFLETTIKNFIDFTELIIVNTLKNLIPSIYLAKGQDGRFSWYGNFGN
ncbi:MAG: hypothetical protein ACYDIA_13460 [Candidatus Humimicrobiaceae bacterium]